MAFAQVINSGNFIEVITNFYAPYTDTKEIYMQKTCITYISLSNQETYIEIGLNTGRKYQFTSQYPPADNNLMVIESVDGVAPIDNDDLLHKIKALL